MLAGLITVVLLVWLVRNIDWQMAREIAGRFTPGWILLGGIFYTIAYAARAKRFQSLITLPRLSFGEIFAVTGIHNLAVRMLPNPTGELVFLQQVKQRGVSLATSITALAVYRVLDFMTLALLYLLAIFPLIASLTETALAFVIASACVLAGGAGFLAFLSSGTDGARASAVRLVQKLTPLSLRGRIDSTLHRLISAFQTLRETRAYPAAIASSLVIWISMFAAYIFFAKGFGMSLTVQQVVLAGVIQVFVNTIPSIAGLGVMETGWVIGLGITGVNPSTGILTAFAVDVMTLTGTILIGTAAMLLQRGVFTPTLEPEESIWKA
ncbi:MAG: flippase-like domain-containing protein [Parcubacteria group bacterium]|nr:flippase-like domain-containing protein [Parcubacteria group bacterium]